MSVESARRVLLHEAEAIRACSEALGDDFAQAVRWALECEGRVITCGVGKSGHIARKTAGTLSSTGTPSLFLHAAEAVHGDLGMVTCRDVVVMYSHSGETDELVRLFPSIKSIGARSILVTGRSGSSAARLADLVLNTGVSEEACPNNLAPTTSTTVMLALSDALAVAVMVARGFGKSDFARFHPSGALGKRLLLRVSDAMRPVGDTAVVNPQTTVLDVMRAITREGVGAACVSDSDGRLLGLISDGDLRRHILASPERLEATAAEIMTANVSSIEPTLLAVEALEVFQMHPKKIGDMPVVDADGKLLGLLMLKDLLRTGIV
jgi:arabinose-5-phosphate isomerase